MQKTILSNIRDWLKKPFPFYETFAQKIVIPVFLAFLVMFLIILIYPYKLSSEIYLKVLSYGFIAFFVTSVLNIILPILFPTLFASEKWNIQKTLFYIFLSVIMIGLVNALFKYNFDNSTTNTTTLNFIFSVLIKTFLIGILPIIIQVFFAERFLYKRNHIKALEIINELNKRKNLKQHNDNSIYTFAKNSRDEITIAEEKLFYIKAEGNYCTLFYEKESILKKHLIRSSLKEVELVIMNPNTFVRCHKSYIINLNKVINITGNAKGYVFYLDKIDKKIPASRNLSKSLISRFKRAN
jgi:hypothetical protein